MHRYKHHCGSDGQWDMAPGSRSCVQCKNHGLLKNQEVEGPDWDWSCSLKQQHLIGSQCLGTCKCDNKTQLSTECQKNGEWRTPNNLNTAIATCATCKYFEQVHEDLDTTSTTTTLTPPPLTTTTTTTTKEPTTTEEPTTITDPTTTTEATITTEEPTTITKQPTTTEEPSPITDPTTTTEATITTEEPTTTTKQPTTTEEPSPITDPTTTTEATITTKQPTTTEEPTPITDPTTTTTPTNTTKQPTTTEEPTPITDPTEATIPTEEHTTTVTETTTATETTTTFLTQCKSPELQFPNWNFVCSGPQSGLSKCLGICRFDNKTQLHIECQNGEWNLPDNADAIIETCENFEDPETETLCPDFDIKNGEMYCVNRTCVLDCDVGYVPSSEEILICSQKAPIEKIYHWTTINGLSLQNLSLVSCERPLAVIAGG